jgi:hypothetical protein
MVTNQKIASAALTRSRLGTVMIWLGVLTWLPFILLRIAGEKPSLFWFLPFHLLGVIGGSRLRSLARKEIGGLAPKKNILWVIGHGLIYAGILVWLPYFYLKLTTQSAVNVMNFLPYHLAGIFGGITLLVISYWVSKKGDVEI